MSGLLIIDLIRSLPDPKDLWLVLLESLMPAAYRTLADSG